MRFTSQHSGTWVRFYDAKCGAHVSLPEQMKRIHALVSQAMAFGFRSGRIVDDVRQIDFRWDTATATTQ